MKITIWKDLHYLQEKLKIFNPVSLEVFVVQAPLDDSP